MQITQMINSNGNPAANQFIINADDGQYFQSYDTLIAFKPRNGDTPTVTGSWDHSQTTLKHLKLFLGTSLNEGQIRDRLKSGALIYTDVITIK